MPVDNNDGRKSKMIPEMVIKRLQIYHRYLLDLSKKEVERISSPELAVRVGSLENT